MRAFVSETGTGAFTHVVDADGALWTRFGTRSSPPPLTCRELSPVGSPVSGPEVCSCSPWGWQHCSPVSCWPDAPVPGGKELVRYPVPRSSSDGPLA